MNLLEQLEKLMLESGERYIIAASLRVSLSELSELPIDFSRQQREKFENSLMAMANPASSGVVWFESNWAELDETGWHYFAKPEIPERLWKGGVESPRVLGLAHKMRR